MVNKELVESRKRTNPANAEEPDRRTGPDPRDQPREILVIGQSRPALLGEPLKGAGQNEAWASKDIAFSQHEVGGDVVSSPTLEQGGNRWTEFVKEITQLTAFLRVERDISHAARAYGPSHGGPAHARRAVGGQRHQTPNSGVDRSPEGRPAAPAGGTGGVAPPASPPAQLCGTPRRRKPTTAAMPTLKIDDETMAELTVLSGFDDDLAGQITATSNRIRGLLTQIHPALERVLGHGWITRPCWTCSRPGPPQLLSPQPGRPRYGHGCSKGRHGSAAGSPRRSSLRSPLRRS